MPRSVAPVALDNRVQHLGRLYVNNFRAAHRLPPGTSDTIYSNHYTSVCVRTASNPTACPHGQPAQAGKIRAGKARAGRPLENGLTRFPQSFAEEDILAAGLHRLRSRANGLFRRRPDPDELRGRPRYRDW